MKKVILKCRFGDKLPNDIVELEDKKADVLILAGHAKLADSKAELEKLKQSKKKGK